MEQHQEGEEDSAERKDKSPYDLPYGMDYLKKYVNDTVF